MLKLLDFIIKLNVDAREGLGEDSWCYAFGKCAGLVAAFDGCGGSGARKHEYYSGHSEAYMASRLCAGAFFDGFLDSFMQQDTIDPNEIIQRCKQYCQDLFTAYRPSVGQASRIKSSMITTLPTTAAAAMIQPANREVITTAAWAGDSRVYTLTPCGLAQISLDDSDNSDPYETDAMMTNTINADRTPRINQKVCRIPLPAIILTATDGCFAYYTTPMEFEGVLLSTLLAASCPNDWESALTEQIGCVAGDDYTLVMAVLGFQSFENLKQVFSPRYDFLRENYLTRIAALPLTDAATRRILWESYRPEYTKYIEG